MEPSTARNAVIPTNICDHAQDFVTPAVAGRSGLSRASARIRSSGSCGTRATTVSWTPCAGMTRFSTMGRAVPNLPADDLRVAKDFCVHTFGSASPARRSIDALLQDARHAFRAVRCSSGLTGWLIGSLAIGMGVVIASLAFLVTLLVGPFPDVEQQWRLVRISMSQNCGRPDCWQRMASHEEFAALQTLTGVEGLAAYTFGHVTVARPEVTSVRAAFVSAAYFDVLGVGAAAGRAFTGSDEARHAPVALLSHRTWMQDYDGDPRVIGRTLRVADTFVEIIGVTPELFVGIDLRSARGDTGPALWLPLWMADGILPISPGDLARASNDLSFVGRLGDGIGVAQVHSETEVLGRQLSLQRTANGGARADVRRVWRTDPREWSLAVLLLMPIPFLVLAISCINAANLMLAWALERTREIGVRLAIGAGRRRIVRQLLGESLILAALATLAAIPLAHLALRLADTPLGIPVRINALVLTLVILTALGTTVTFGLMPALRASAQDPWRALTAGTRGEARPRQSRGRRAILTTQVALSIALLAMGWQLVSAFRPQATAGTVPADRILIARFDLHGVTSDAADAERIYDGLLDDVSGMPGVSAVGLAGYSSVWRFGGRARGGSLVVWLPGDGPEQGRVRMGGYAGGDLFTAVGARIVAGRGFTAVDRRPIPDVAVVNETLARQLQGSPLGSTIHVAPRGSNFPASRAVRIVGIVESTAEPRIMQDEPPPASVYLPSPIEPEFALALYIQTRGPAGMLAQPLREFLGAVAPRVPVQELGSLDEISQRSYAPQLWLARTAVLLGAIGVLLAGVGVYAVSSYIVGMRSREFAIRMAIGAAPASILRLVFHESLRIASVGFLLGGLMAFVAGRVIQARYHGFRDDDVVAVLTSAALFVVIMAVAGAIPAIRASRVDPVRTLADA
jgi:predicted permease